MKHLIFGDLVGWLLGSQTVFGWIMVATGTIVLGLSSILRAKGEKHAASRKKETSQRSTRYYALFGVNILIGAGLTTCGTWLTKHAGEVAAQKANERSEQIQREFREKFQTVLAKLNAAKQEDSKRITEEKIRVIQTDLSQWADNFVKTLPTRKKVVSQLKAEAQKQKVEAETAEMEREIQLSSQASPVLLFAIRFVQESVRAYAKRTAISVAVDSMDLPENICRHPTKSAIRIGTNATWKLLVVGTKGPSPEGAFAIEFADLAGQESGCFTLRTIPDAKKLAISYTSVLPTPDLASLNSERDIADYEATVRNALQRIIEAQLLQAEK